MISAEAGFPRVRTWGTEWQVTISPPPYSIPNIRAPCDPKLIKRVQSLFQPGISNKSRLSSEPQFPQLWNMENKLLFCPPLSLTEAICSPLSVQERRASGKGIRSSQELAFWEDGTLPKHPWGLGYVKGLVQVGRKHRSLDTRTYGEIRGENKGKKVGTPGELKWPHREKQRTSYRCVLVCVCPLRL